MNRLDDHFIMKMTQFAKNFILIKEGHIGMVLSGGYATGLTHPKSDYDIRGFLVLPSKEVFGLLPPPKSLYTLMDEDKNLDISTIEIGRAFESVLKFNIELIEQFVTGIPLIDSPILNDIRELVKNLYSKDLLRQIESVHDMYTTKLGSTPEEQIMRILYGVRIGIMGLHLARSGKLVSNIYELIEELEMPDEWIELIHLAINTLQNQEEIPMKQLSNFIKLTREISTELGMSVSLSKLPEKSSDEAISAFNEYYMSIRYEYWNSAPKI